MAYLVDDERFVVPSDRKIREEELARHLEKVLGRQTTAYWL